MKFALLNVTGAGLLVGAFAQGWLDSLFANSLAAYWCWAMIVVVLVAVVRAGMQGKWGDADWVAGEIIKVGLLGTVVGLGIAISGNEGGDYALRDLGVATAVQTTIVGLIGNLWINLNRRLVS